MKDPKSGWYYSYSADTAITSTYEMGIQMRRSKDLMVRKMVFINGWPVLSPEPYAGEDGESVKRQYLLGKWEVICLDDESNDAKYSHKIQVELNNV